MSPIVKVLHTARTATTGGREYGAARSSDGLLDIRLSSPGSARIGANPEQLFAAAWSASLESAISAAARQRKVVLPPGLAMAAEVDLCLADGACFLQARLAVSLPGVEREVAQAWWMKPIRRARTRKQHAAISTSSSTWSESDPPAARPGKATE